jgi:hypothetical protein
MFVINSLIAFLLLVSYLLPYISPKDFASLSVLSLGMPLLILFNLIFFIYWLLRVKKQMVLSLIVLLLGWNHINAMYRFSSSSQIEDDANLSVMSYNVRFFNRFGWLPKETIKEDILEFIGNEEHDVLCLQEYRT